MTLDAKLKIKIFDLRKRGYGINEISRKLKLRKNTVSWWCRGTALTPQQLNKFKQRIRKFGRRKHQKAMALRIEKNQIKTREIEDVAAKEIGKLTKREKFLIGIALYWAEGFKHRMEKALGLANSDPVLVKFYVNWLAQNLKIRKEDLILRITTNISLEDRVSEYRKFWSKLLGIPETQFRKPFFQHTLQKRVYPKDKKYYGVIRVYVRKSSLLFKKMRGWIKGLNQTGSS